MNELNERGAVRGRVHQLLNFAATPGIVASPVC